MRKAVECDMEALKGKDWLALELVRGLSYTILQKWLLQEQDTMLHQLVLIAEQWQVANSAQTAFGSKSTEYVRHASEYKQESSEYIRKASYYIHQIKENWKHDQQTNDSQSFIDECQGCGAHRDKMHIRDDAPLPIDLLQLRH